MSLPKKKGVSKYTKQLQTGFLKELNCYTQLRHNLCEICII